MGTAHRRALLAAAFSIVTATSPVRPLFAQVDSGARVRITTQLSSKRPEIGTLLSADADSLRFTSASGLGMAVPTTSVTRLEYSRGRRSNSGRGATIGTLVGAGTGLLLAIAASQDKSGWYEIGPGEVVQVAAILGATGAGIGALIGAASHSERWKRMPVPGRSGSQASRGRSPALAGLRIQF